MIHTAKGAARNETELVDWLMNCPAVSAVTKDGDLVTFTFDPEQMPDQHPDGVFFDLAEAPF